MQRDKIEKNFDETLKGIKHKVDKLGKQPIHTEYILSSPHEDKGYQESLMRIRDARKEILIIGDYSPENFHLKTTDKRNEYFEEIEKKIEQAIADDSIGNFKYTRIIVRENTINSRNSDGKLELRKSDMKGDEQSFIHLCRVKKIYNDKSPLINGVNINFKVSKPIPNLPSILLIDGKYMLITMPMIEDSDFSQFITDGVIYFTFEIDDIDGKISNKAEKSVARFQSIFDKISNNANGVVINPEGVGLEE